jgi:dolichol-phosphate mannosyltransferase
MTNCSPRILATLATYNERENLRELVMAVLAADSRLDVLVIDDNSPDGTGQLADELSAAERRVRVLHRPGKLGLGTATIAGMQYGIAHGYEAVLNMDADFSHHPRHIPALLSCMEHCDVAIGSRYVPGGGTPGWPWRRRFMSRAINAYARWLLRLPVRDTSGAFRCYRVSLLRQLDFTQVLSRGYSFQEEILFWCRRTGGRLTETPIVFEDRRYGQSKIHYGEAASALRIIARLGLRAWLGL